METITLALEKVRKAAICAAVVAIGVSFSARYNSEGGAAAAATVVSKPSLAVMTADIRARTKSWSTVPATVDGVWYTGSYAVISVNTGESGLAALYVNKGGSTIFVCGGGGALTRAAAVEFCHLSRSVADKIFPM